MNSLSANIEVLIKLLVNYSTLVNVLDPLEKASAAFNLEKSIKLEELYFLYRSFKLYILYRDESMVRMVYLVFAEYLVNC